MRAPGPAGSSGTAYALIVLSDASVTYGRMTPEQKRQTDTGGDHMLPITILLIIDLLWWLR